MAILTELCFCLFREVVTFNHFLEEAAEKEVRGKVRLQHFIENLLQRVDLAEKQLEYYQNQQIMGNYSDVNEHVVSRKWSSRLLHSLCFYRPRKQAANLNVNRCNPNEWAVCPGAL